MLALYAVEIWNIISSWLCIWQLLVPYLGTAVRSTVHWILQEMTFPGVQHLVRQWMHVMLQYTWHLDKFPIFLRRRGLGS